MHAFTWLAISNLFFAVQKIGFGISVLKLEGAIILWSNFKPCMIACDLKYDNIFSQWRESPS